MNHALPDVNYELHPRFPESKPLSKQDIINSIDEYLKLMIQDLSSQGKYLPCYVIRNILKEKLKNVNKRDQYISEKEIPTWEKFFKCHGRIEELIKLFCIMSPLTSLYELEQALVASEGVHSFEELCLGPIVKHPLVQQYFRPPKDIQKVPEISLYVIMSNLQQCLHRSIRDRNSKLQLDEFLEFMQKSHSLPSKEHLCVKISSFPLAIQASDCMILKINKSVHRVKEVTALRHHTSCVLTEEHSIFDTQTELQVGFPQ